MRLALSRPYCNLSPAVNTYLEETVVAVTSWTCTGHVVYENVNYTESISIYL